MTIHAFCYSGFVTHVIEQAWAEYGDVRRILGLEDISATVSTNRVYRVELDDGHEVIAKTTVYGSYVYFRQDHQIIQQWIRRLANTRYRDFLANILLTKSGDVFTTTIENNWIVFYEKTNFYDFLPKVLNHDHVLSFGREMAEFHDASANVAPLLSKSWKSLGSDVATLYDFLGNKTWREEHHLTDAAERTLRDQCDKFLMNAEKLGYHQFKRMPVLIDWNIANFSVGFDGSGFKLFSRWDYDWFRIEPRTMDFYFCARVVREEGDQDDFSYTVAPFFEQRFYDFLRAYHEVSPLAREEVLFMKEAYRVFLLNYVIRIGEHFFKSELCQRLHSEALDHYFLELDQADFSLLFGAIQ